MNRKSNKKSVLIVAGEASGDLHGAALAAELRRISENVTLMGIGGDKMAAQGVRLGFHVRDLAVVGIVEVLGILPRLFRAYRWLMRVLREDPPDVVVLIDYAEFNLFFAGRVRKRGIPVVFYISPQIWAWRRGRVRRPSRIDAALDITGRRRSTSEFLLPGIHPTTNAPFPPGSSLLSGSGPSCSTSGCPTKETFTPCSL